MERNNNKHRVGRVHSEYKGPFPPNKNFVFDYVRKNMRTQTDGPTTDMRSYNDSTVTQSARESQIRGGRRPKPFKKKAEGWFSEHWIGCVIGVVVTAIASGVGIIVFDHGNQIVSIKKDIEYMKEYDLERKNKISELEKEINDNTINIKLIQQKMESLKESQNKSRK